MQLVAALATVAATVAAAAAAAADATPGARPSGGDVVTAQASRELGALLDRSLRPRELGQRHACPCPAGTARLDGSSRCKPTPPPPPAPAPCREIDATCMINAQCCSGRCVATHRCGPTLSPVIRRQHRVDALKEAAMRHRAKASATEGGGSPAPSPLQSSPPSAAPSAMPPASHSGLAAQTVGTRLRPSAQSLDTTAQAKRRSWRRQHPTEGDQVGSPQTSEGLGGVRTDGSFWCGAALCAAGSICCQSRDINAALCCMNTNVCRFSAYDYETGIRSINALGKGSPRCFACGYPAKHGREDWQLPGSCPNPHGGSKYYGPVTAAAPKEEDSGTVQLEGRGRQRRRGPRAEEPPDGKNSTYVAQKERGNHTSTSELYA